MPSNALNRIHFVGSIPLGSSEGVFSCLGPVLGPDRNRIPEGETGDRGVPFPAQKRLTAAIAKAHGLVLKQTVDRFNMTFSLHGLAKDARVEDVVLGPLGFSAAVASAYADFRRCRAVGKIGPKTRMQISLPTPLMLAFCFVVRSELKALWPAFERAMARELAEICTVVPPQDLAINWDIAPEVTAILEAPTSDIARDIPPSEVAAAVARITDVVPTEVEVGWHLCYGDTGQYQPERETFHIVEPRDAGVLVDIANQMCALTRRSVSWVHIPVPRERDDDAYFAPLARLKLKAGTTLALGLVHQYDGLEGAKRRIAAARNFFPEFMIGTECGMGRRPPELFSALLDLHVQIARQL